MNLRSSLLRVLRRPTLWVVALCYAVLLQAALAPVVRAAHDPVLPDAVTAVLCLSAFEGDGSGHLPGHAHDVDCCLAAQRLATGSPALAAGSVVVLPALQVRLAGSVRPGALLGSAQSIDLPSRGARAPPAAA